jgi:hypothetical protein
MRRLKFGGHFYPIAPLPRNGHFAAAGQLKRKGAKKVPGKAPNLSAAYCPNGNTCRPSRCRTIQNNSTVSKVSEIEVAAAAPWPP